MIERFNPASLQASQTLIGNLLQLNTIIIRDCVSVIESEFLFHYIGKKFFRCLAIIKNFEKCLIFMQQFACRLCFSDDDGKSQWYLEDNPWFDF